MNRAAVNRTGHRWGTKARANGAISLLAVLAVVALNGVASAQPPPAASERVEPASANREERSDPRDKTDKAQQTERSGREPVVRGRAAPLPDLAKLRAEYDRLREDLFKARVRSQKAAETTFASRLDIRLRWKGGPDFVIRKARFLLDGAELWDSGDRPQTDDLIQIAERSVKPGPHALTVRLEIRPKTEAAGGTKTGAEKLGYVSDHTFAITVADKGRTHVVLTGDEDGDPPEYEPELELEIETEK